MACTWRPVARRFDQCWCSDPCLPGSTPARAALGRSRGLAPPATQDGPEGAAARMSQAAQDNAAHAHPQQQEMPLAVVHGQPVLQIPQDLYIPPDALEV